MNAIARLGAVAVLLVAAAGCPTNQQSMINAAGPGARSISHLALFVFVVFGIVALVMFALILIPALRRKGTLAEHAPVDAGGGQGWILIGGIAVPFVILVVIFGWTIAELENFPLHGDGEHRADIRITGRQWWWDVEYVGESPNQRVKTANEIHIPVGQPVVIELESADVVHSFWVPRLHGKVDLIPGVTNRIRIQADQPGIFDGQCGEFCGVGHSKMRLLIVATAPEQFAQWIALQALPAVDPVGDLERRGKMLFETKACGLCHTIRGTDALGSIGPDLTHLASRRGLAANSIPNDRAHLTAWITRAQFFKPEVKMPNLADLTGEELTALSAYLQGLK
jgi:cytochrome c oxidase subunit 2